MTSPDSPSPAIAPLVAQIKSGTAVDREQAAAALWSLAWNDANRVAIAEHLVTLVTHGAAGGQEQAARALGNLAYDNAANQAAIAAAGAIDPLVALVRSGAAGGKERAAGALANIACNRRVPRVSPVLPRTNYRQAWEQRENSRMPKPGIYDHCLNDVGDIMKRINPAKKLYVGIVTGVPKFSR